MAKGKKNRQNKGQEPQASQTQADAQSSSASDNVQATPPVEDLQPPTTQPTPEHNPSKPRHVDDGRDYSIDALRKDLDGMNLKNKSETEIQELHKAIKVDGKVTKPMKRPGYGDEGKKIQVITNWLAVKVPRAFKVYQYDVTIERQHVNRTVNAAGTKEGKSRAVKRRDDNYKVFQTFVKKFPAEFNNEKQPLYDRSKTMYSVHNMKPFRETLKQKILEEDANEKEAPTYTLHVKPTYTEVDINVSLYAQEYQKEPHNRMRKFLSVVDQLCRQKMYHDSFYEMIGQSFYEFNNQYNLKLDGGRQLVYGTYQSPALLGDNGNWRFCLNVDIIASAFYEKQDDSAQIPGITFICSLLNVQQKPARLEPFQIEKVNKLIRGMEFKAQHTMHRFKVHGLSRTATAASHKFTIEKEGDGFKAGEKVSLLDYFKRRYKINLQYPDWPLLEKKANQKITYFPVEVCNQAQRHRVPNSKLTSKQQADIVKNTALAPAVRLQEIMERASYLADAHNKDPTFKALGITVDKEPMRVPARILPPPRVRDKANVQLRNGGWNMDNRKLMDGKNCADAFIALISVVDARRTGSTFAARGRGRGRGGYSAGGGGMPFSPQDAQAFYATFQKHLGYLGLYLPKTPLLVECADMSDPNNLIAPIAKFDRLCKQNDAVNVGTVEEKRKIIILINSDKDENAYGLAKYECGVRGIVCQCIQSSNARKAIFNDRNAQQLMSNMALKMNAKLGGVNHEIQDNNDKTKVVASVFKHDVLVLGLDVTHDTTGRSVSIGALVSSINTPPTRYIAREIIMPPKREIVELDKMKQAVIEALKQYRLSTGRIPRHIIYYRDGVSDGQFAEVLLLELCAIQQACLALDRKYRPFVTFVVVQKRHHTRLFRHDVMQKANDKPPFQNVEPGTIVDQQITHPYEYDFFLVAHQGIQGTSKPTHYYVLLDDANLGANVMQQLTHFLSYTYARATKAVSLPAPAYYAHHVCTQAKMRLVGYSLKNGGSESVSSHYSDELRDWRPDELEKLHENIKLNAAVENFMHFQ